MFKCLNSLLYFNKSCYLVVILNLFACINLCHGDLIVTPVISTFDNDLEDWQLAPDGTSATLSHSASLGNPPGGAFFVDGFGPLPNEGTLRAPEKFLGDWSLLNGIGVLKYDHLIVSTGTGASLFPLEVNLSGPGGAATFIPTETPSTPGYVTVTVPIEESQWNLTSGTWSALLDDVTILDIGIEVVINDNTIGSPRDVEVIDNIILVPEPSSFFLAVCGLLIGILAPFRRRSNSCRSFQPA